ncbi:MAG TPA: hypothetical protein VFF38_02920 [Microvirga sp.]|nr:hypothetical protein [Microvirga sp.]
MTTLKGSRKSRISLRGGRAAFVASLAIAAGIAFAPMPAEAARAPREAPAAKALKSNGTAVAVKDVEETGSIETDAVDTSTCDRSRKRLFVEGEGWIVRRVTTCY